jgi:hypothetical protein
VPARDRKAPDCLTMFARIGIMRALDRHAEREFKRVA